MILAFFMQTLPQQNVFAYLPLRSYGFRFIIQGDFEVPSSREDVDGDKPWNQWLREEIPQLFIDALSVFMVRGLVTSLTLCIVLVPLCICFHYKLFWQPALRFRSFVFLYCRIFRNV